MKQFDELFQTADWKKEKHVPLIECPNQVQAGEVFPVKATVGKEVAHPNTTEHHIRWISIYFQPEGENSPIRSDGSSSVPMENQPKVLIPVQSTLTMRVLYF